MLEMAAKEKTVVIDDGGPGSCEVCSYDDDDGDESLIASRMAIMYCIDCREKLCDICSSFHSRTKALQSHRLVDIVGRLSSGAEAGKEPERAAVAASTCNRNAGGRRCCPDCDVIAGELAFDGGRGPKQLLAVVSACVARCRDKLTAAGGRNRCELVDRAAEIEAAVRRDADRLHEVVEERRRKLLNELADWRIRLSDRTDHVASQLEKFASASEKLSVDTRRLTNSSSATATRRLTAVQSRTEDLLQAERRLLHELNDLNRIDVTFEPTSNLSTDVGDNDPFSIGRIKFVEFTSAGKDAYVSFSYSSTQLQSTKYTFALGRSEDVVVLNNVQCATIQSSASASNEQTRDEQINTTPWNLHRFHQPEERTMVATSVVSTIFIQ